MSSDWERLRELQKKRPSQYGQSFQVAPNSGAGTIVTHSADVIRWESEGEWDVRPWRVYLRPWQPQPDIAVIPLAAGNTYADTGGPPGTTPWNTPPGNYNSFTSFSTYARVHWGTAGVRHEAFVDWPERGLLFQVSGSYVQIDAIGQGTNLVAPNETRLPLLGASIGPEPGGGDSPEPATFTYRKVPPPDPTAVEMTSACFSTPPFARSFTPIVAWDSFATVPITRFVVEVWRDPALTGFPIESWRWDPSVNVEMNRASFPLHVNGAIVRYRWGQAQPFPVTEDISTGCRFQLDL